MLKLKEFQIQLFIFTTGILLKGEFIHFLEFLAAVASYD